MDFIEQAFRAEKQYVYMCDINKDVCVCACDSNRDVCVYACNINGDVCCTCLQVDLVNQAFQAERQFLVVASKSKEPAAVSTAVTDSLWFGTDVGGLGSGVVRALDSEMCEL